MPSIPRPKASKKKRGEVAVTAYAGHPDPYMYLAMRFVQAKTPEVKDRLALELLPYERPKLKQVDVTQTADIKVSITIGGDDADN